MIERNQAPQALLIHGAAGSGRRYVADWLATKLLRTSAAASSALAADDAALNLAHPDFMLIQPLPDKHNIKVEQVRELIDFLHLTSHRGGTRVVVVWPAETMTIEAANSLLKTLEEPPRHSAIILITAATASLPPTVLSRCHRLHIRYPSREMALAWLRQQTGEKTVELLLDFAGGGPFGVLPLLRDGFSAQARQLVEDLRDLRVGRETPIAVARRWAGVDRELLLRWLYLQSTRAVEEASGATAATEVVNRRLQNRPKPLTIQAQFERLRAAEDLYRNRGRALNLELQLGAFLQRWYRDASGDSSRG